MEDKDPFPFIKGWWIVLEVLEDQPYEGWVIDVIGGTLIIEVEPSELRLGVPIDAITKIQAYREKPES